jgi:hypothetical protein
MRLGHTARTWTRWRGARLVGVTERGLHRRVTIALRDGLGERDFDDASPERIVIVPGPGPVVGRQHQLELGGELEGLLDGATKDFVASSFRISLRQTTHWGKSVNSLGMVVILMFQ